MENPGGFAAASFSPDGRRVFTDFGDTLGRFWDAATGQPVSPPRPIGGNLAFSPDWRLVVAGDGKSARVWDAVTGAPVGELLRHDGPVKAAIFSPDGRRVVTGSGDGTARVWETATGRPVGSPLQHQGGVYSVALSPDGQRVLTSSYDGTARVWQVLLSPDSVERVQRWADLAEIAGGYRVSELNSVVPLEEPDRLERVRRLVGPNTTAFVPVDVLLRSLHSPQQ
jgi:WD40 repeat protein